MEVKINESTVTRILQTKDQQLSNEIVNPDAKRHRTIIVPELELALKEFILIYQHRIILSDAMMIEKAKLIIKLHEEAGSVDEDVITESLPLLQKCKKNKECISVSLCANADRSHKLAPLIIGKYTKPRCFKNVKINNLTMTYRSNAKAWMLVILFQEWLQDFDYQILQKHRSQHVLLLLDNYSSHKLDGLTLRLSSFSSP
ncbi:11174_t:CDS:2, partial [Racocetra persica]